MAATATTETYDALWTLTMRAKRKRLTDNISDGYPTIGQLRKSGMLETEQGGKQIQEDLMYALASAQWFDTYDVLATDRLDGITAAFYDWSYMAVPIVISMTEEKENRKSDQAVKLITAKTTQAMQGAFDQANASALGAMSGKSMLGYQDIISTTAGATVGGIDSSVETWWDNVRNATAVGFLTQTSTGIYDGPEAWGDTWNSVSEGNDQPDTMITTYALYGNYETIFEGTGHLRTSPGSQAQNALDGRNPTFRGATIIPDRDCGTGLTYFTMKKYLKFKVQAGMNFAKTPFKEPANQLAKVGFIVLGCQLTTNHRARLAVKSAQTAA